MHKNVTHRSPTIRRPGFVAFLFAVVASALCSPAFAQEAWCKKNLSNCVMSEPFTSTSYTRTNSGTNYALFTGDQSGSKIGQLNQPANGPGSIAVQDTGSNTFGGNFIISTDSSILNLLPKRDPTAVPRFLRAPEAFASGFGAVRFGYSPIPLGTTVKRIAMRWYTYHSPVYDYAWQGSCTNGKIAHSSRATWGTYPLLTLETNPSYTHMYSFKPDLGWVWSGHSSFEGFGTGAPRAGPGVNPNDWKGKWFRNEVVVRRPRTADSGPPGNLGFDFQFFTKNVTDNGPEIEDVRFSAGCKGCMANPPGGDFVWNTGTYPTMDMSALHTELFRQDTCRGWQGWLYATVAKWDTDAGQRIGAAEEIEGGAGGGGGGGGGAGVSPPPNLQVR